MQGRSSPSLLLLYVGVIAAALAVIALGLTTIVKASTAMSHASAREKTLLELQADSSRQIRQALATPISIPPLAPITARRDLRDIASAQANKPLRTKPSQGMDAIAMDQSGTSSSSSSSSSASSSYSSSSSSSAASSSAARYTAHDRHSANW
jgi:hypothetical protein